MEPVAIINPILEGNFYTSSKKNSFYQVKVDENYLGLLNTNGSLIKTRMISIRDIVGCRCARRRKRIGENCECHPKCKNRVLSFLENTLDEQDISAYLHIYSYIMKNSKTGSALKRESFKLTLRFRLFSSYEDNLKEAIKWRNTLKGLVEKTQWRNPLLKNVENYEDNDSKGYTVKIYVSVRVIFKNITDSVSRSFKNENERLRSAKYALLNHWHSESYEIVACNEERFLPLPHANDE